MASLGHVAVGLVAARYADGRLGAPGRLLGPMVLWPMLSLLPDADVLGFALGVRYGDPWGHRGATHSLAFALGGGMVAGLVAHRAQVKRGLTAMLVTVVLASHGLLDTLTDGGLGVALTWPCSLHRYFAPWRPIPVAPIGLGFLSARGLYCAAIELGLFAPLWLWALFGRRPDRRQSR